MFIFSFLTGLLPRMRAINPTLNTNTRQLAISPRTGSQDSRPDLSIALKSQLLLHSTDTDLLRLAAVCFREVVFAHERAARASHVIDRHSQLSLSVQATAYFLHPARVLLYM